MTDGMATRSEVQAQFDLLRMEMRALIYQATFVIIATMLAVGGIMIGLLVTQ